MDPPQYGRFHLLPGLELGDPTVHVRLQRKGVVEALIGADAFSGSLGPTTLSVIDSDETLSPVELAVLLAAPGCNARIAAFDGKSYLHLSRDDADGFPMELAIIVEPVDAGPVVTAAFEGFIAAIAGMEAVLDEFESERAGGGRTPTKNSGGAGADGVRGQLAMPTRVRGGDLVDHPAFKQAVLGDPTAVGSRAHGQAGVAMELRAAVEARREQRRRAVMGARKKERRNEVTFADEPAVEEDKKKVTPAKKEPDLAETPRDRESQEGAPQGCTPGSRSTHPAAAEVEKQSPKKEAKVQTGKEKSAGADSQGEPKPKPKKKKRKKQRFV